VGCKALASFHKKFKALFYPVKHAKKLYGFFLFSTVLFFQVIFPQSGFSVITDTTNYLIIPVGETYTSSGTHTYASFVQIDGTLNVRSYIGSGTSGWLELICSSITISATGKISADGAGYRGGNGSSIINGEGSGGGTAATCAGGAGYGGVGGIGIYRSWEAYGYGGISYGSIANPTDFGSGGGVGSGNAGGGAGGGRIKIVATGEIFNSGIITANGANGGANFPGYGGGGSGGCVYILANTLSGDGSIKANGGPGGDTYNGGGAGGRIALYYTTDNSAYAISAYSGNNDANRGGAGTIYKKSTSQSYGDVFVNNNNKIGGITYLCGQFDNIIAENKCVLQSTSTLTASALNLDNNGIFYSSGTSSIADLNLSNGATIYIGAGQFNITGAASINSSGVLYVNSGLTVNNMTVYSGGLVSHSAADPEFDITVNGNLTINSGGQINVNGMGYHGGDGVTYSNGEGAGGGTAGIDGAGGGYGGNGGTSSGAGGLSYGSMMSPSYLGSGGGVGNGLALGGAGGGKVKLTVDGTLTNDGAINANGFSGYHSGSNGGGGGSGGSIYIIADQFAGSGVINANGGNGDTGSSAGGGAGGRIAVFYNNSTYSGSINTTAGTGGNPEAEAGTKMVPTVSADSPSGISNSAVGHVSTSQLTETILVKTAKGSLTASGTLSGSINISTIAIVTINTGGYKDKGFYKGAWSGTLDGVNYQGQIYGMAYLNTTERKLYLKGVMEGVVDGSFDGCLLESLANSNTYDTLAATWSFRVNTTGGGSISSGRLRLVGSLTYDSQQEYANTGLNFLQTSAQGTLAGGYTGNIKTILTNVYINDTGNIYDKDGFTILSYQWGGLSGMGWGFADAISAEEITLKLMLDNPMFGTASGLLKNSTTKSMWFVVTKLDIGESPQPDIEVELFGPGAASPGQTVTYTIEVKNNGLAAATNKSIVLFPPVKCTYIAASGEHKKYDLSCWDENDNYYSSPVVRWNISLIDAKSVKKLNGKFKILWGLPQGTPLSADLYLLDNDAADGIFPTYNPDGDHD